MGRDQAIDVEKTIEAKKCINEPEYAPCSPNDVLVASRCESSPS